MPEYGVLDIEDFAQLGNLLPMRDDVEIVDESFSNEEEEETETWDCGCCTCCNSGCHDCYQCTSCCSCEDEPGDDYW